MRRQSFCDGWEYSRNGGPFEAVHVPHDAMLGERRGPDAPAGSANGYFFGGVYRYRKGFALTEAQVAAACAGALVFEFESVYRNAVIRVNGAEVPDVPPYGFTPFFVSLAGLVHAGENTIEVEVDVTPQPDLRWYSGAGLIRPVWLWEPADGRGAPADEAPENGVLLHIPPQGVRVSTLGLEPARINVAAEFAGESAANLPFACDLRVSVLDGDGGKLGERVAAVRGVSYACELTLPQARPWSPEEPALYVCEVCLSDPATGHVLDMARVRFGIRTLAWSSRGLFVNGRGTLLRGGCIHHDNGPLGACTAPEAERRRVAKLKSLGFNALRMAHNPASGALLDACDELGMFVMDEAWDTWFMPKSAHDYAREFMDHFDADLTRMVRRDVNHPSVIIYSIGNEVADPIGKRGKELERMMVDLVHTLDPTRPVTCGFNLTMMVMERLGQGWYRDADEGKAAGEVAPANDAPHGSMLFNLSAQAMGTGMSWGSRAPGADALVSPALDAVDIAGYNYASPRYKVDAKRHPGRIMLGTETYPHHLPANWRLVRAIPQLVGDFQWAAWDYLGEAGANAWCYTADEAGFSKPYPWISAGSGCFDLVGSLGAHGALAAAVWGAAASPRMCVRPVVFAYEKTYRGAWRGSDAVPSWSWKGCAGFPAHVEVYDGRATRIRLEINGRVAGMAYTRNCLARFTVPYERGKIVAVGIDDAGREIGRDVLCSADGALRVALHVEEIPGGRCDAVDEGMVGERLVYVWAAIEGENGEVEANADTWLAASVEGGELVAFASGAPAQGEPFASARCRTHYGRALAIVRAGDAPCALSVEGELLGKATIRI